MLPALTNYEPSPTMIRLMCADIQRTWTPEERQRRAEGRLGNLYTDELSLSDLPRSDFDTEFNELFEAVPS